MGSRRVGAIAAILLLLRRLLLPLLPIPRICLAVSCIVGRMSSGVAGWVAACGRWLAGWRRLPSGGGAGRRWGLGILLRPLLPSSPCVSLPLLLLVL